MPIVLTLEIALSPAAPVLVHRFFPTYYVHSVVHWWLFLISVPLSLLAFLIAEFPWLCT